MYVDKLCQLLFLLGQLSIVHHCTESSCSSVNCATTTYYYYFFKSICRYLTAVFICTKVTIVAMNQDENKWKWMQSVNTVHVTTRLQS